MNVKLNHKFLTAIGNGDVKTVVNLIEKDAERLNMVTAFGTWLIVASRRGKLEIVKELIQLGADVNIKAGTRQASALKYACSDGHLEIVKYLLSHGAEVDTSEIQQNPLFGAITDGHKDVVSFLIDYGIDLQVKYKGNRDVLTYARELGELDIARMIEDKLKELGKDVSESPLQSKVINEIHKELVGRITSKYGDIAHSYYEHITGIRAPISIHIIPPSDEYPFHVLFTAGVSDYPMEPLEPLELQYVELLVKLPPEWSFSRKDMRNPLLYWPLGMIRRLGYLPHKNKGYLKNGMVFPNENPMQPFAKNTKLCGTVLSKEREISNLIGADGQIINFFALIFLYKEEADFATKHGAEALLELFDEQGISPDVVQIDRKNVCLGRRLT